MANFLSIFINILYKSSFGHQYIKTKENFRKEKQWQSADQIRRELEKLGWQVEDTDKGPKLLKS